MFLPHCERPSFMPIKTKGKIIVVHILILPMSEAARSKVWVCGYSLAEMAGSNPAGSMDVCLL